jgi:hypothetical protein
MRMTCVLRGPGARTWRSASRGPVATTGRREPLTLERAGEAAAHVVDPHELHVQSLDARPG